MNPLLKMIIYCYIAFSILTILLIVTTRNTIKHKWLIYSISTIITIIIHYSIIIADYIKYNELIITDNLVLPMYPCNAMMWYCFILIFFKNKESFAFKTLCEIIAICGTICSIMGTVFNPNFYANPNLSEYEIIKGLISHTTMLFSCLYLFFAGYFKFNYLRNTLSLFIGCLSFLLIAIWINGIYIALNIPIADRINVMFLKAPYDAFPWLNFFTGVPIALSLSFLILKLIDIIIKHNKTPK